jgi:hypothetical protein
MRGVGEVLVALKLASRGLAWTVRVARRERATATAASDLTRLALGPSAAVTCPWAPRGVKIATAELVWGAAGTRACAGETAVKTDAVKTTPAARVPARPAATL